MADEDLNRYAAAAHAMQSGVAFDLDRDPDGCSPKELRVGINAAHVGQLALARLLIARGLFTEDEYMAAQADAMQDEVRAYEQRLSAELGTRVHLT
jgi:hypothetical protein